MHYGEHKINIQIRQRLNGLKNIFYVCSEKFP